MLLDYGNVDGDGDGTFHGFIALTGNGSGIPLDPPGSTNTSVGITASGILFGDYTYLNHHGFVGNGGVFTTFDNGIAEAAAPFHLLSAALPTPAWFTATMPTT